MCWRRKSWQLSERGVQRATLIVAAGTGGTLAGLLAGLHLLGSRHQVLGIDVGKLWRGFPASIAALASEICHRLGQLHTFHAADVPIVERTYVGPAYAHLTDSCQAAIRTVARQEGLLLDPVYTAKAMAGLIDQACGAQRRWQAGGGSCFSTYGGIARAVGLPRDVTAATGYLAV